MSTLLNPGSPEQQEKKVKSKKNIHSQFRSFLLLAAIYSLIIHHVQKNSKQAFPGETVKKGVTKQGAETSVNEANAAFKINGWDFRNASFIAPPDFNNTDKKSYGN